MISTEQRTHAQTLVTALYDHGFFTEQVMALSMTQVEAFLDRAVAVVASVPLQDTDIIAWIEKQQARVNDPEAQLTVWLGRYAPGGRFMFNNSSKLGGHVVAGDSMEQAVAEYYKVAGETQDKQIARLKADIEQRKQALAALEARG